MLGDRQKKKQSHHDSSKGQKKKTNSSQEKSSKKNHQSTHKKKSEQKRSHYESSHKSADSSSRKKTKRLSVGMICILMAVAIAGFIGIRALVSQANYRVAVNDGQKYYSDNDFKNAVSSYQAAVNADPKSEEAIIGLAKSYEGTKDYSKAKEVLRDGLSRINSSECDMLLSRINFLYYGIGEGTNLSQQEIDDRSKSVALDETLWKFFVESPFSSYKSKYSDARKEFNAGVTKMIYSNEKFICYYENSDVLDNAGTPQDKIVPSRIELMDLNAIFKNMNQVIGLSRLKTIFGSDISVEYDDTLGCDAVSLNYEGNTLVVACDAKGNIISPSAQNYLTTGISDNEKCELSGKVLSATTAKTIKNASLTFTSKDDSTSEVTASSNEYGQYSAKLVGGNYTVTIKADGYADLTEDIKISRDKATKNKDFSLSSDLENGQIRIVLTWGSTPQDLDSYLFDESGQKVSFNNKTISSGSTKLAELDLDDTNSYGPETTTIYVTKDKQYKFKVNDYRHESSTSVQNSQAVVKVYMPNKAVQTINVPTNQDGTVWNVLEIDNGELKIVNQMASNF